MTSAAALTPAATATVSLHDALPIYTDSGCTANAVDQTPATNTVTNHLAPDSAAHTFTTAGTWYWQAVYSGDALNATATSPCNETLVIPNEHTSELNPYNDVRRRPHPRGHRHRLPTRRPSDLHRLGLHRQRGGPDPRHQHGDQPPGP